MRGLNSLQRIASALSFLFLCDTAFAFENAPVMELQGPWDVHLGELVDETSDLKAPAGQMMLPGYLSHPGPDSSLAPYIIGVATLVLRMDVPQSLQTSGLDLALDIDRFFSVGRVIVLATDSTGEVARKVFNAGDFGTQGGPMRPIYRPGILPIGQPQSVEIFFQLGNDVIPWLGVENPPLLGAFS